MKKYIKADMDAMDIKTSTWQIKEAIESDLNNIFAYVNKNKDANKDNIKNLIKDVDDNIVKLKSILGSN